MLVSRDPLIRAWIEATGRQTAKSTTLLAPKGALSLTHAVSWSCLRVNSYEKSFGHGNCVLAGVVSLYANERLLLGVVLSLR